MKTVLSMRAEGGSRQRLYFKDETLDGVLGGISHGGITEVSGEAGCGKTQILCFLSLLCQTEPSEGGLGGKAMYLHAGEGMFPHKRLQQMAEELVAAGRTIKTATQLLDDVLLLGVHNPDEALDHLNSLIPRELFQRGNVKLLVIDSIGGLMRSEFEDDDRDKYDIIFRIGQQLKWIADTHGVAVVVVNHVKSGGDSWAEQSPMQYSSCGRKRMGVTSVPYGGTSPTLGFTWAHCVKTRIRLSKDARLVGSAGPAALASHSSSSSNSNSSSNLAHDHDPDQGGSEYGRDDGGGKRQVRSLYLEYDPGLPPRGCLYEITRAGVFGVPGSETEVD